jgi:serine/threonine-protein kinase
MLFVTIRPGDKIGPYEVISEVGRGGMATVFKAHHASMGRHVALKVLPEQFLHDPSFLSRFTNEARVIAALEHPRILPVYDFGEAAGVPYIVMRLMPHGSTRYRLRTVSSTAVKSRACMSTLLRQTARPSSG